VSPPGRPKGDVLSAQRAAGLLSPPGRPKGDVLSAQRAAGPISPPGRPRDALPRGGTVSRSRAQGAS